MKKILGVIVLGLLLSGNAYAENIVFRSNDFVIIDIKGKNWRPHVKNVFGSDLELWYQINFKEIDIPVIAKNYCEDLGQKTYLLGQKQNDFSFYNPDARDVNLDWNGGEWKTAKLIRYFCAKNKDKALEKFRDISNLTKFNKVKFKSRLVKEGKDIDLDDGIIWSTNDKNAKTFWISRVNDQEQKIVKKEEKIITTSSTSNQTSTKDKITQSKQICTDLGFQPKTEKHADCSMQMMSIQFEATNKVASSSGGTKQEIIVKHKNDYDIFDAMIDMSNALLSNGNNSSSSSSSNNNTRCVIGKTNPTFGTTTMNCR